MEPLFNKVAGLQVCNFIKKRLQDRCFPVKFVKVLRTLRVTASVLPAESFLGGGYILEHGLGYIDIIAARYELQI